MRKGIRLEDAAVPEIFLEKSAVITDDCIEQLDLSAERAESLREEVDIFNRESIRLVDRAMDVSMVIARILESDGSILAEAHREPSLIPIMELTPSLHAVPA